jgi:two-component system sensor histidine kinase TtrS
VDADAFGGFQIAWRALHRAGIEPDQEVAVRFTGFPMDQIAERVRDGDADAGILRACLLEEMVAEGRIAAGSLRVLSPQSHYGFRCTASTELYPDWPFAKTRQAPRALAKRVAEALYAMPADHPAAVAGGYAGWTIPVDYQPVHELFRTLHLGPYAERVPPSVAQLMEAYWPWFAIAAVTLLWGLWHVARVEQQVRLRTIELSAANARLKAALHDQALAEERARQHEGELAHVARVATVGELAAGLAHEINQPLAAIANYAEGCRVRLREQGAPDDLVQVVSAIEAQANRAGAIVHRLRGFLRKEVPAAAPFDLDEAVAEALSLFLPEARRQGVAVRSGLAAAGAQVRGEAIQVEQVVLNLLRNALEALDGPLPRREIELHSERRGESVRVRVRDSGAGLTPEARQRLFEPFFTTKAKGMGLGLSISRSIVESHGGRLTVDEAAGGGTEVSFTLPIAGEE